MALPLRSPGVTFVDVEGEGFRRVLAAGLGGNGAEFREVSTCGSKRRTAGMSLSASFRLSQSTRSVGARVALGKSNAAQEHRVDIEGNVEKETKTSSSTGQKQSSRKKRPGGVVSLGKFDALHIGHRALAEQAARMGSPVLLSFSGMGDVLGWAPRLPVAAVCDRKRIMSIWAKRCGGVIPQEYALDFAKVRSLSPQEFVRKLATELQVSGVVAGANYRFGYKAAGDASDLVHLCNDYGLQVFIVDPVMDTSEVDVDKEEMSDTSREKGQVSSTKVRKALANGDLARVGSLLGRKHRLVLNLENARQEGELLYVPLKNALNQGPREGCYDCTVVKTGEPRDTLSTPGQLDIGGELIGSGQVKIGPEDIEIRLLDNDVEHLLQGTRLGLEFPYG